MENPGDIVTFQFSKCSKIKISKRILSRYSPMLSFLAKNENIIKIKRKTWPYKISWIKYILTKISEQQILIFISNKHTERLRPIIEFLAINEDCCQFISDTTFTVVEKIIQVDVNEKILYVPNTYANKLLYIDATEPVQLISNIPLIIRLVGNIENLQFNICPNYIIHVDQPYIDEIQTNVSTEKIHSKSVVKRADNIYRFQF